MLKEAKQMSTYINIPAGYHFGRALMHPIRGPSIHGGQLIARSSACGEREITINKKEERAIKRRSRKQAVHDKLTK